MLLLRFQILVLIAGGLMFAQSEFHPSVPRTWDQAAIHDLELPLARPEAAVAGK